MTAAGGRAGPRRTSSHPSWIGPEGDRSGREGARWRLLASEPEEPAHTNVVDLMAALKKSLGQAGEEKKPAPTRKMAAAMVMPIKQPQAGAKRKWA